MKVKQKKRMAFGDLILAAYRGVFDRTRAHLEANLGGRPFKLKFNEPIYEKIHR